ncbi:hypothetical protein GQ54DRAFT_297965 [Martensiomyces pterosporus]|nr:hypothetical protein GQ54DRAFT_297965 [Martensiomyces pterosporus]
MSLSADAGVAALGLLMAFSNHRPQQPHTATSRVRKRAIFASILSLLLHEHLSKRLTYIERTASAIATATLAFASVDRPNDTLISLAHVCRIIRVLYGGYNSDGSLAIATGTLALTHAYLVWISLSQPLRERLCFWTSSIVYLDVCSVVCSVSSRSSKLDSHNMDDNNGYFASYASRSRHLVLSPTTR